MKPLSSADLRETECSAGGCRSPGQRGGMFTASLQLCCVSGWRTNPGDPFPVASQTGGGRSGPWSWDGHHLDIVSVPQFPTLPNVCITIPLSSLREKSLTSMCLCSTWHFWSLISVEGVRCESYKKHIERWWGKGCTDLTTSVVPEKCPCKPTSASNDTSWFLSSTSLAKEDVRFNQNFTLSLQWW